MRFMLIRTMGPNWSRSTENSPAGRMWSMLGNGLAGGFFAGVPRMSVTVLAGSADPSTPSSSAKHCGRISK